MVKAKAGTMIFLGLSELNLTKLINGAPILIKKEDLNIEYDIVILAGKTEDDIVKELMEKTGLGIGPNTIINDNRTKRH